MLKNSDVYTLGREQVGKKGVVRDPAVHLEVLEQFLVHARESGFTVKGIDFSPIRGPEGNIEYIIHLKTVETDCEINVKKVVDSSHENLESA